MLLFLLHLKSFVELHLLKQNMLDLVVDDFILILFVLVDLFEIKKVSYLLLAEVIFCFFHSLEMVFIFFPGQLQS